MHELFKTLYFVYIFFIYTKFNFIQNLNNIYYIYKYNMSNLSKINFTTALSANNRCCGLMNTATGSVSCCRIKNIRAGHTSEAGMPRATIPEPLPLDPDFDGSVTKCKGDYQLFTDLDTDYTSLYNTFQTNMTDIINNGTKIDINQAFFDDMYNQSSTYDQLVQSHGTMIIKNESKTYIRLTGDIKFNPEPLDIRTQFYEKDIITKSSQKSLMTGTPPRLGYTLGWFATIAVENQQGTVIDLNNKTLEQSDLHHLQQRFFR